MAGTSGDDWIASTSGDDTIDGGGGSDTVSYAGAAHGVMADLRTGVVHSVTPRIMPLGDSITYGLSSTADQESGGYRTDLWQQLQQLDLPVEFVGTVTSGPSSLEERAHEGHPGWKIEDLDAKIESFLDYSRPDYVMLMIGTNNRGADTAAEMIAKLRSLLTHITDHRPDTKVMVSDIPPVGTVWADVLDPATSNTEDRTVQQYNEAIPGLVAELANQARHVAFVDAAKNVSGLDITVFDGIHPNASGYQKIAAAWYAGLRDNGVVERDQLVSIENLTGSGYSDSLSGNDSDNVLDGGGGSAADVLVGLGGNDVYIVNHASDLIVETQGQGFDRALARVSYALPAAAEIEVLTAADPRGVVALTLSGNVFAQTIEGNDGDDLIDGGGGTDTLVGFAGNDWYYVDNAGDSVIEATGGGNDRVFASTSWTLTAGSEVEILSTDFNPGTAAINLTGNELANTIFGNAGDNVIDGKAGADTMVGFGGNDWYYVDNAGDRVVEAAGGGSDRVFASTGWTLTAGSEVEVLSTDFNPGTAAINLTGNELANTIFGNAGANILDGKAGADTLVGFAGNDWYYVDNASDRVVEAASGGSDRVFASASWNMTPGSEIEMLTTDFNAGTTTINLRGNEYANAMFGNAGTNVLSGGGGSDTLWGFGGTDYFLFEASPGPANLVTIGDYDVATDQIVLVGAIFPGLPTGALSAAAFFAGTAAHDSDDRIIYDPATGNLFFDPDGVGGTAQVKFAVVLPGLAMNEGEFRVI